MSLMVRAQARDLALSIRHPQGHLDSEVPGRNHFLSRMMAEASGFQAPDGGGGGFLAPSTQHDAHELPAGSTSGGGLRAFAGAAPLPGLGIALGSGPPTRMTGNTSHP